MDGDALTAAHRSLPFGSEVRVANLDNGREVVVRINDRGPFSKGRIIDVSRAAAEKLGMIAAGVARVSVNPVRDAVASDGGRRERRSAAALALTAVPATIPATSEVPWIAGSSPLQRRVSSRLAPAMRSSRRPRRRGLQGESIVEEAAELS